MAGRRTFGPAPSGTSSQVVHGPISTETGQFGGAYYVDLGYWPGGLLPAPPPFTAAQSGEWDYVSVPFGTEIDDFTPESGAASNTGPDGGWSSPGTVAAPAGTLYGVAYGIDLDAEAPPTAYPPAPLGPEPSAASAPVSNLIAFTSAPTVTDVTGEIRVNDPPDYLVGTDLGINEDGFVEFLTDGLYAIGLDLAAASDADVPDLLTVSLANGGPNDNSYLSWGNAQVRVPLVPSSTTQDHKTIVPTWFTAGSVLHLSANVVAGVVSLTGIVFVTRLA